MSSTTCSQTVGGCSAIEMTVCGSDVKSNDTIKLSSPIVFSMLAMYLLRFSKERHSRKQVTILILKTILFILQNMFQSIHTSSSVAKK